ncbi:lipid-A-disaccharide synthase [Betaproteobacteria bacterium SCN2]|jgi:lipid-A-disaccharide synthase|nr:lipid-A-disaccharide synthase [Betaproteobacteria bacterium SCN2]
MAAVGLIAGEASGDLLGAELIRALKARHPSLQFEGIVGPRMVAAGAHALASCERLSVNGYVEVLRHLPDLLRLRRETVDHFLASRPQVFVGIDAPDFNFGVEAKLKAAGIPAVHFVSPSIWAWRGERIHKIGQSVSHMLVMFPFEEEIYRQAGIPVTYVGHPMADRLPLAPDMAAARLELGIKASGPVIALLPGSRRGEVKRLAPLMLQAAKRILASRPAAQFLIPAATEAVESSLRAQAVASGLPVKVLRGQSQQAMTAADVVVLASGTATLEAALLKKPMVITYKVPAITAWIARGKLYLPYVGLPNILLGRFAVPELLQENATPDKLAEAVLGWLDAPEKCAALAAEFRSLHETLRCNAGERIAEALEPYLM